MEMQWLNDLIEKISVSKAIAFSIFATALVLVVGPSFSSSLTPLEGSLKVVGIGALVYSSSILGVWLFQACWDATSRTIRQFVFRRKQRNLSETEIVLVKWLGERGTDHINLNTALRRDEGLTKLEVMTTLKELKGKGLVDLSWDESYVWLTDDGRVKALQLMKMDKESAGQRLT